jgi:competence protein ComEC
VLIKALKVAAKDRETILKPGDILPLRQTEGSPKLEMLCVSGNSEVITDAPGAPENPIAKDHKPQAVDKSDNARSLGFVLKFGGFRFLDLGDLTWNIEYKLVHPSDKLGPIDVYQSTHHGLEISNNPVLIRTVTPRVAIFNNGPKKGGHPLVIGTLRRLPEVPDIYQAHRNLDTPASENTDPAFIANSGTEAECKGEPIWVTVAPDVKTYTVTVGGTLVTRKYNTRLK